MALNTRTFAQLVQDQAAAVQARASGLVDFAVGAVLRALTESVAAVVLWLQGLILAVLAMTRLATSTGSDIDSFVADFFGPYADGTPAIFRRLGAQPSMGDVTFSRITATGQVVISVGATVATADGSQRFVVILDTLNASYSAALGGYVMANGVPSVTVQTSAVTPGAASNVLAATINTITSPIPGVDTVTNADAFVGGLDAETPADFINRFQLQILALREATPTAILAYALGVRFGIRAKNVEGLNPDNTTHKGYFYVVVDDGTGSPSSGLLNAVRAVVDAHRADGIEFSVIAPVVITADIFFGVASSLANSAPDRVAAIAAVRAYINNLEIGETLTWTRLYQVTYDASPTITGVVGLTINGGTADIPAAIPHVVKAGNVAST